MKRSPLKRKTPLRRSQKPLARKPLKQKSSLKKMSEKREKEIKEYGVLRKIFLSQNPSCQVESCDHTATDVHHVKGRGKYYLDVSTFMAVCRPCHDKIHFESPKWAREKGYLA
jgi:hypothetical protein